jgi:glycosyltransferase involved in cell wall biosynthesis
VKTLDNNNIEFWSVPEGEVPKIQSSANVLLLPIKKSASLSSFPSKLPSYMFSSKPIIACVDEESDIANVIKSIQCGWIVAPQNIDLLSNMMSYVISVPEEELHFRGRNGYNYALANLSKKNNLKEVIKIINEMISR